MPNEVREVADALIAALGDNLSALLWHGSWARGEQTVESDHDMIVLVTRLDDDTVVGLRQVFEGRSGWSTYVKTEQELRQYPLTGRLQFHYGLVPLYGRFVPPPLSREALVEDLRLWATSIQHECRYRIIHGASRHNDADLPFMRRKDARWMYYQAKAAVMAMKARELLAGHEYPGSREELRRRLADADELEIVDSVDRWHEVKTAVEQDLLPIAALLDKFAKKLVRELESSSLL